MKRYHDESVADEEDDEPEEDEDGYEGSGLTPLLPIFEAAQLDALPVYNLTHAIRHLVVPRCETTLSWDQLRSPQVSQFLVKPIQQQILASHFTKATLYALIANCLQFNKEAQMNPGNSGTSKTRALICELLAMKLLKEFTTRELIDALSYDFYPLQGLSNAALGTTASPPNWDVSHRRRSQPPAARISTLEIAIRAQSKRFLAHPVVVQHLEAIWAGTIVFHSAADNLHRVPSNTAHDPTRAYGTMASPTRVQLPSPERYEAPKQRDRLDPVNVLTRRSVTLYDPRDASLFKLSRLRVPRYRHFLSTCSFAVLLCYFVAVLIQRSLHITPLEVVFWFWSAGFMLDEIVGFNEQGFGLYIMSFWNTFDLGILVLLFCYYCMRLYGILMPDLRKRETANLAYDFLAANAVLLFPRLFSVLDHYRYFSQLLIAFRMMAADLVAVFILIIISLSGFFVAFTLGFGNDRFNLNNVIYFCFQMLMGFTPAAWERWTTVNFLGKGILTLFLFVCHFLIVTILITVLTNSFMAIVQNANDEHQFVFAVNTISMVKSDALFSYIAPTNVIAWILSPLRYVMPFREFVRLNRTVIKITHFPILFGIYAYERLILRSSVFEPTELVEQRGRTSPAKEYETRGAGLNLFSPRQPKVREPSVTTFYKDRALDEVFRRPFKGNTTRRTQKSADRRLASNVVNHWMQSIGSDPAASPPADRDRSIWDGRESRRSLHRRSFRRRRGSGREFSVATRSIASDPEDFGVTQRARCPHGRRNHSDLLDMSMEDVPEQATDGDADGDDELITNDDMSPDPPTNESRRNELGKENQPDYFQHQSSDNAVTQPMQAPMPIADSGHREQIKEAVPYHPSRKHQRHFSTNTILYNPQTKASPSSASPGRDLATAKNSRKSSPPGTGTQTPRTPKRQSTNVARPRPILAQRATYNDTPNIATLMMSDPQTGGSRRDFSALDIASDLGDNKAIGGAFAGTVPASFATQKGFMMTSAMKAKQAAAAEEKEDQRMLSKLMLSRMKTLEEGFSEVLREVKDWRKEGNKSTGDERFEVKEGRKVKRKARREGKGKGVVGRERDEDWVDDKGGEKDKGSSV
ncbi:hypothetical protein MMC30_009154 [Trapelia coarctata]|nr:hypothetical protein [Trapelia coarctata]